MVELINYGMSNINDQKILPSELLGMVKVMMKMVFEFINKAEDLLYYIICVFLMVN